MPYPHINLGQKAYRFNILDAANDRGFNLQLYYASTAGPFVTITSKDGNGSGASAAVTVAPNRSITNITITSGGAGYTSNPNVTIFDAPGHTPAGSGAIVIAQVDLTPGSSTYGTVTSMVVESGGSNYSVPKLCIGNAVPDPSRCTEVRMVPAVPGAAAFPADWQGISNATGNQYS